MHAFTYHSPTEIIFGPGTEDRTADLIRKYGGTHALLVYGGGSAVRSGLLGRICKTLEEAGLSYTCFGGAKANPTLEHAREGVKEALRCGADFLLGIGGGSAIDTAKAIAIGAANPQDNLWDFWERTKPVTRQLPIGAVLTIPAAGSESSNSAVLTNTETGSKRGLGIDGNRPRFAIMNPELAFSLPPYQIACGVTDIMMHTLDRYFNPLDNEMTDAIAEALLRTVIEKGAAAVKDPHNYDAMSEIMWAGSLSHNGLTGLGGVGDFAVHQLGHELSAMFDTAHGASLATVWESWARAVWQEKPMRFARYARNVWNLQGDDMLQLALAGIDATVNYFRSIGMPASFQENKDIGIQEDSVLRDLAYRCTFGRTRTIGSFKVLGEEDIYQIYQKANH